MAADIDRRGAVVEVNQFSRRVAARDIPSMSERITASILHDLVLAVGADINIVRSH